MGCTELENSYSQQYLHWTFKLWSLCLGDGYKDTLLCWRYPYTYFYGDCTQAIRMYYQTKIMRNDGWCWQVILGVQSTEKKSSDTDF